VALLLPAAAKPEQSFMLSCSLWRCLEACITCGELQHTETNSATVFCVRWTVLPWCDVQAEGVPWYQPVPIFVLTSPSLVQGRQLKHGWCGSSFSAGQLICICSIAFALPTGECALGTVGCDVCLV